MDIPLTVVLLILLILFALPASEGAVGLYNTLVTYVREAGAAGRLRIHARAFRRKRARSVAVPCLITDRDTSTNSSATSRSTTSPTRAARSTSRSLSDWPTARSRRRPHDLEVLDYAKREIAELSARYAYDGKTRFYLLHRRRLLQSVRKACGWAGSASAASCTS